MDCENGKSGRLSPNSIIVKVEGSKCKTVEKQNSVCSNGSMRKSKQDHAEQRFSVSSDSDSLIVGSRDKSALCYQLLQENFRLVLVTIVLCLLGIGLVAAGIIVEAMGLDVVRGLAFFIAGGLCLIPGLYHLVYICCAVCGCKGYDLYNLPIFT
ncbi:unnamed protein product [Darwinula stevensoni]|uniref:Transmembrane protein 134 n=1 Tax=Darwinula stevensoni TaxID=69355 RepID=A0A7R8XCV4_9CRUS|nr:unnamed protein product [Darwinula stevensoni]CAG0888128.1 unnamed protein product [Darwinula stevensoni]